ncbi:MAG TPA: DUF4031 domain-containing protein [Ktedonobacterales bacterium]
MIMVDELIDYGKKIGSLGPRWCHLTTDDQSEAGLEKLHDFAHGIGLKRVWCSDFTQPHVRPFHYDLIASKRAAALKAGAVFVTGRDPVWLRLIREGNEAKKAKP